MSETHPVSTLHLTDDDTAVHAQQCVDAASFADVSSIIVVAFAGSPVRWLDQWRSVADTVPERVTVVVVDDATWLAGTPRDRIEAALPPETDVRVETVASPGNLTDIGVTLTEILDAHPETTPHLCFQSVTVLLQYAATDAVYQFLHTLIGHLDRFGATGHFHLHAGAHDDETIGTVQSLYDQIRRDTS